MYLRLGETETRIFWSSSDLPKVTRWFAYRTRARVSSFLSCNSSWAPIHASAGKTEMSRGSPGHPPHLLLSGALFSAWARQDRAAQIALLSQKSWLPGHSGAAKPGSILVPRAQPSSSLTQVGPGEDNAFLSPTSALSAVLSGWRQACLAPLGDLYTQRRWPGSTHTKLFAV